MEKGKFPLRKCVGCGKRFLKSELFRVVRTSKDKKLINISICSGYIDGRGAYVCKNSECLKKARKARRFEKSFSCKVDTEIYDKLERLVCETER